LKFQAIAEKTAENLRGGLLFCHTLYTLWTFGRGSSWSYTWLAFLAENKLVENVRVQSSCLNCTQSFSLQNQQSL